MTYESTIRINAPHGLTDDQQRVWGDLMDDAKHHLEQLFIDAGAFEFVAEAHGPEALVA